MKFITVIIFSPYETDVQRHDSLEAAKAYLERFRLGGVYGKDYFIAVMVEQVYVVPEIKP